LDHAFNWCDAREPADSMPDHPDANVKSSTQTTAHSILGTATSRLRGLLSLTWDCSVPF
jgi:hypothetical protein